MDRITYNRLIRDRHKSRGRKIFDDIKNISREDFESLGPLKDLLGTWKNEPSLPGRGWNMIALPFEPGSFKYRLLVNQYNETLDFFKVDSAVPNRGINLPESGEDPDQFLIALDYQQSIQQIDVDDFPESGKRAATGADIHHEPGLWLSMTDELTSGINLARLATIPHGNSALALGKSSPAIAGKPVLPDVNGLPIGVPQEGIDQPLDPENPTYLDPYKHYNQTPFKKNDATGFPGFDPVNPTILLELVNSDPTIEINSSTELMVTTEIEKAGIVNIPFIERQADTTDMTSHFWIQEVTNKRTGKKSMRLQYLQIVMLDFFPTRDDPNTLIRWPHISINTMEKVS